MEINRANLPKDFPTHQHNSEFWEQLGRTIATFGLLEEVLGKAIFAFTATRHYAIDEIDTALKNWLPTLEQALSGQLYNLIELYGKAVRSHEKTQFNSGDLELFLDELKQSSIIRNVLCHSSWREPDSNGNSVPFFISKKKEIFDTPVNVAFLKQVRRHIVESICLIIQSVTDMGWQFPGSARPGRKIWDI